MPKTKNIVDAAFHMAAIMALVAAFGGMVGAQEFTLTEQQFNQWLTNGQSLSMDHLTEKLATEIDAINVLCQLTPEQRRKLELAGAGDAARFDGRVTLLREELVDKTYPQQKMGDVYQRIQPYRQQYQAGVFGERSLFRKALRRTLSADQLASYEASQNERRTILYAAKVRLYVAVLERAAPMRGRERQALIDLLLQSTHPPRRFGEYDTYYVMHQASQVPTEKLEALLDEAQLKVIRSAFQQGANYRQFLEQQGYEPAEKPAGQPAPNAPVLPEIRVALPEAGAE